MSCFICATVEADLNSGSLSYYRVSINGQVNMPLLCESCAEMLEALSAGVSEE